MNFYKHKKSGQIADYEEWKSWHKDVDLMIKDKVLEPYKWPADVPIRSRGKDGAMHMQWSIFS